MISADVIDAMVAAGCTPKQLAAAIRADQRAAEEKRAAKREKDRIRQQKHRARHASHGVTECDPLLPLEVSPAPLPKTSTSPSPSSLRSSGDAPAHMEFHDNFWPAYPHKVGKQDAERAFVKARRQAPLSAMLAGLRAYIDNKPADRPWLNPATWLNGCRWNDQPAIVARGQGPPGYRTSDDMLATLKRHLDNDDDGENSHQPRDHQNLDHPLLGLAAKGHERD